MYIRSTHDYGRTIGLASSLVKTLKDYGKPLPVDFLARIHGRTQAEIQPYLDKLEEEGFIDRHEGNNQTIYVKLLPSV